MNLPAWTHPRVGERAVSLSALIAVTILFSLTMSCFAQTNINIGTAVKQSGAKRFGMNLANQDFYDNGIMLRNLVFRNPGFEGETWTTILQCATVTATSCQDPNSYNSWPANFVKNGTYTFMTGPAAGESGTVTSQDPANNFANVGATLHYAAPAKQPNAGDFVQVRTTIPGNGAAGYLLLNQGGAVVSTDTTPADQAPGTTGTQCLQITGPNPGQSIQFGALFDTTAGRSFVQLNGSFTVSFKAKSLGGSNQFLLQVFRGTTPQTNYLTQNVNLTNSWNTYSYTFNAADNGSQVGAVGVYFNFDGNSLLLDDLQMSPNTNAYNTAFRDEVVQTLLTLKPGVLRYMDSAQGMGTSFDNIIKDQFGRQRAGWSSATTEIDTVPVGLFDFLQLCKAVGAEPYWTMPTATTPAEMAHIMEYLAGSSTTTYGAKRANQGQAAPWTTVFPVIHMELGNEVWNAGSFSGETMPQPDVFGAYANTVFGAAKATSYYAGNAGKFEFIIGGLEVNEYITQHELDACPSCDAVALATYMMSTLSDVSSVEAVYGPMMAFPQFENGPTASASDSDSNHMYQQVQTASGINDSSASAYGTKNPRPVAVYETNMGLTTGTAPQSAVTLANAGVGAGVSLANHMLMMLRDLGIKTQNMFALSEYQNAFYPTASGAATSVPLWGTVIDMGGPTNLRRPEFLGEQLANSAILPTMLTTTQTGTNPKWNQALNANLVQLNNVQYIQSYAFTDGTHQSVVVMNLNRTASLPVTFSGANAPIGSVTIKQLTSANVYDTNESSPVVNITTTSASGVQPGTAFSLPPFSMTVFLWPGTALPGSSTILTANPQTAVVGQSVSFTASVSSSGATPSGTVTFFDGSTSLGSSSLNSSGTASYSTSTLPTGSNSITAFYGGDSVLGGSSSSPVTVNISSKTVISSTTTTLSSSLASAPQGQNVTLTAVVASSGKTAPTGTVTFKDDGTSIGTGTLNAGTATFSTSSLGVGAQSITAAYGGDSNNNGSNSNTVTVTVSTSNGSPVTIPNGTYTLANRTSTTVLDDPRGATTPVQIIQFQGHGSMNQQWIFASNGSGFYTIQNQFSSLYLTDPNKSTVVGTALMQESATNDDSQLWELFSSGVGYAIQNKASSLAIDYGSGQGIVLEKAGGANQPLIFTNVTPVNPNQPVPNGNYVLTNLFTNTVLDDNGGAAIPGLQILQWPADGGPNQSWRFNFQNGFYTIQNVQSAMYLTSPNSSTTPGIPLVEDPATNDASQLWLIVPYNGSYVVGNKLSGLVIDYPWATGIDLWSPIGSSNQLWSIAPAP